MTKSNHFVLHNQHYWLFIDYFIAKNITLKRLKQFLSKFTKGESPYWEHMVDPNGTGKILIKLRSIPTYYRKKFNVPDESIIQPTTFLELRLMHKQTKDEYEISLAYHSMLTKCKRTWGCVQSYYEKPYIKSERKKAYSMTHVAFQEVIALKKEGYLLKNLFESYRQVAPQLELIFRTESLDSFKRKVRLCRSETINKTLTHDLVKLLGNHTKLTPYWISRLEDLYSNRRKYPILSIHRIINLERKQQEESSISASTIYRFVNQNIIKNKCGYSRNGAKWFRDNLLPHLTRSSAHIHIQWQIDGTKFPFVVMHNGEKTFFDMVLVVDVHSNRIIGYSLGPNENFLLIKKAMHMASRKTGFLPLELVHDPGSGFKHKDFKLLRDKLFELGCNCRASLASNPQDKAHAERLFGTLNTTILKFFEGFVGEGIKSSREYAHPSEEVRKELWKVKNVRTVPELKRLFIRMINEYNSLCLNQKPSSNEKYKMSLAGKTEHSLVAANASALAKLYYNHTEIKVKRGMVKFTFAQIERAYTLPLEKWESLTGEKVLVYFDPSDFGSIYLFNPKTTLFICKASKDLVLAQLKAHRTPAQKKHSSRQMADRRRMEHKYRNEDKERRKREKTIDPRVLSFNSTNKEDAKASELSLLDDASATTLESPAKIEGFRMPEER